MLAHSFQSPVGTITAVEDEGCIVRILFGETQMKRGLTPLLRRAEEQIVGYLRGEIGSIELPVHLDLSAFAHDVMQAMSEIPYGTTITYPELAARSGHPGAARAVGTVCRKNPLPIVFPCHRVVPSSGGIGRYSGPPDMKTRLLRIEGISFPEVS